MNNNTIIDVHMINNKGFIWKADDWFTLRTKYRLLGSLIGISLNSSRQYENGLPSLLLPEEVRIIVENDIGRIVKYSEITLLPNDHNTTDFNSGTEINDMLTVGDLNSKEVIELNKEVIVNNLLNTAKYTNIKLDEICSNVIEIPLTKIVVDLERTRYKVFKDLWLKGYYLSCGMKFGGDFLVYEGDPLAYHAKYIINCRDLDKEIMVSHSRVGAITNKKMVLAIDDGDFVNYFIYHLDISTKTIYKKSINFVLCK